MTTQFRDVASVRIEYIAPDSETISKEDKFTKPERVTISDFGYMVVEEPQKKVGDATAHIATTHIIPLSSIRRIDVVENIQF